MSVTVRCKKDDNSRMTIELLNNGEIVFEGYEYITYNKMSKQLKNQTPAGAFAAIKGPGSYQAIGEQTSNLVEEEINKYNNRPDVKIPRERSALVDALSMAFDKFDYLRDVDYDNDIGMLESTPVKTEIEAAEVAIKEFDKKYPEYARQLQDEENARIESSVQSAWNA